MVKHWITIKTTSGTRDVLAEVFGTWAVHENHRSDEPHDWDITHVPTGMRVYRVELDLLTKKQACRIARALNATFPTLVIPESGPLSREVADAIVGEFRKALGVTEAAHG